MGNEGQLSREMGKTQGKPYYWLSFKPWERFQGTVKGGNPSGHSKLRRWSWVSQETKVNSVQSTEGVWRRETCRDGGLPRSAEGSLEYSAAYWSAIACEETATGWGKPSNRVGNSTSSHCKTGKKSQIMEHGTEYK